MARGCLTKGAAGAVDAGTNGGQSALHHSLQREAGWGSHEISPGGGTGVFVVDGDAAG